MGRYDQIVPSSPPLPRTSSCNSTTSIIPSSYTSSSHSSSPHQDHDDAFLRHHHSAASRRGAAVSAFLRSLFSIFTFPPSLLPQCKWLVTVPSAAPSLGRRVTGTLFGNRRGHVSFAVQEHPGSEPVFVVELAVSTSALVREMSSGMVRIALECQRAAAGCTRTRLFGETAWKMYCNGKKCGQAVTRSCTESDWHVLTTVRRVSVGAGVIPAAAENGDDGELLYMRARFERVVGSRDSEAFYMLNPDGTGGPELSIFLLRI